MLLYRSVVFLAILAIAPCAFAQVPGLTPNQIPAGGPNTVAILSSSGFVGVSPSIAAAGTDYISNGVTTALITNEVNAESVMAYSGTAVNLYCSFGTASVTAGPTINVRINGVTSALTMTCATGATTCNTAPALTAAFTAGQTLDIQVVNTSNTAATGVITCGFRTT